MRDIAHECALLLLQQYDESRRADALIATKENDIHGGKACAVPGGYKLALGTALLFLEKHHGGTIALETYNCKQKNMRFKTSALIAGANKESWLADIVNRMKEKTRNTETMLKTICRLDSFAEMDETLSRVGFGFELKWRHKETHKALFTSCRPEAKRKVLYPMAFLPKEIASHKTFMTSEPFKSSVQSYIPEVNESHFKREKGQTKDANLEIKPNIQTSLDGKKQLNVSKQREGVQKEQQMLNSMLKRLRNGFVERVEITPLCKFTSIKDDGIKCRNSASGCRWLDLRAMIDHCREILIQNTTFWQIDPIVDYYTLNVAACLAVSHISLSTMSDVSVAPHVRAQHCETFLYMNQLLRCQKSGKLYKKTKQQLSRSVRGFQFSRPFMLCLVPPDVYRRLCEMIGLKYASSEVIPLSADLVQRQKSTVNLITERITRNESDKKNDFNCNVLKCAGCQRLFFGGKGNNDIKLYQEHLLRNPTHRVPLTDPKITRAHWKSEFKTRQQELQTRYRTYYSLEQKRAYDVVMQGCNLAVFMGVAGSGKSTLVQDLKYLLECVFWQPDEIAVCGSNNATAKRMGLTAKTFHSFLGIGPMRTAASLQSNWEVTVDHCMQCMKKHVERLKKVRFVIIEEGLELSSNMLEAFFKFVKDFEWNVIILVNGDVCQGNYREDSAGNSEISFFANNLKVADICPAAEILTFIEDHRTKDRQLMAAKAAIRNASVDQKTFEYLQSLQYESGKTPVDIILCAHISDMQGHNSRLLATVRNHPPRIFVASSSYNKGMHPKLNYADHGVDHILELKISAPVMITCECSAATSKTTSVDLGNGTLGTVVQILADAVQIRVPILGDIIVEIRRVTIPETHWKQIPMVLAYATTIAKSIGFEFESVAMDFGIKLNHKSSNEDLLFQCMASYRRKQMYTAITRSKQNVYFIGYLRIELFNNMDMKALNFFESVVKSNRQRCSSKVPVVRDIHELREYWIQSASLAAKRFRPADDAVSSQHSTQNVDVLGNTAVVHAHIDGARITIFAEKFPKVLQHMHGHGYFVVATSNERRHLLLQVKCQQISQQDSSAECKMFRDLHSIDGVLHLLAPQDELASSLVFEGMPDRVEWQDFLKHASDAAKAAFQINGRKTLAAIHSKGISHGNISERSVWTNIEGAVKFTWFPHDLNAGKSAMMSLKQKDITDFNRLCSILNVHFKDANANAGDFGDGGSNFDDYDFLNDNDSSDFDVFGSPHDGGSGSGAAGASGGGAGGFRGDNSHKRICSAGAARGGKSSGGADGGKSAAGGGAGGAGGSGGRSAGGGGGGVGGGNGSCDDSENCLSRIILFCLQGADKNFGLHASLTLWCLTAPTFDPTTCVLATKAVAQRNYGSSFKPFITEFAFQSAQNNSALKRITDDAHSLVIHLGIKLGINPIAIDAFTKAKQNERGIRQDTRWKPADVLSNCCPREFRNANILILSASGQTLQAELFYCSEQDGKSIVEIVLLRKTDAYTLIDVTIELALSSIQGSHIRRHSFTCCEPLSTLAVDMIHLPRCNGTAAASQSQLAQMWKNAVTELKLDQDCDGRWTTRPPGLSGEKSLQDGSLQDSGWSNLKEAAIRLRMADDIDELVFRKDITWHNLKAKLLPSIQKTKLMQVVDFGSEGGYCVAQMAIEQLVSAVTGKELQYSWVAYSALIMFSVHMQSRAQKTYLADVKLLCGTFLDLQDATWMQAIREADLVHCDNWNWCKGQIALKESVIPGVPNKKGLGEVRRSLNANVACILRDHAKSDAHFVVYRNEHFPDFSFDTLKHLELQANWNTCGDTDVYILRARSHETARCPAKRGRGAAAADQRLPASIMVASSHLVDNPIPPVMTTPIQAKPEVILAVR